MGMDDIEFDGAKFNEVWRRVMSDGGGDTLKPSQKNDEAPRLRAFMAAECEAVRHVMEISARCCNRIKVTLEGIAACDRRHIKELRARCFILTGERYSPPELCPVVNTAAESLRSVYIAKIQLAAEYTRAAGETSDRTLSELYARLAKDDECAAGRIYNAITYLLR